MLLREFPQDRFVQANAGFEVLEREVLVRRMRATIGQRQTNEQRFRPENRPELRGDRDAAALAYERGLLAVERFAQRTLRRFAEARMRIRQIPRSAVTIGHLQRHSRRAVFLKMLARKL